MFKKYRWNFVFVVLIVSVIGFVIFDIFLFVGIRSYLFRQTFDEIHMKANLAKIILEQKLPLEMSPGNDELWDLAYQLKKVVNSRVTIIDNEGKVLTDSDVPRSRIPAMDNHLRRPEVQQAILNGWGQSYRTSATVKRKLFYSAIKIDFKGENLGFFRFAYYAQRFEASMAKILQYMVAANIVGLLILSIAAFYLGSVVTHPILSIVRTAQRIVDGDLERTFPISSRDEVGVLSQILNDLTLRLKTQIQQISHERHKLANILTQLNTGILAIDRRGKIIHANAALMEMLEMSQENIIGKKIDQFNLFKPVHEDVVCSIEERCQKKGEFSLNKKGTKRFIRYQVGAFQFAGDDESGALVQLQDISDLKQLEAIRKNFVASASHELKTPLTAIIGYAETLKEGALNSRENAIHFVNRILDQAQRLEYLVSDLLKLSRLEHDMPMDEGEVQLTEIIDSVLEEFAQKAEQKQIKLTKDIFNDAIVARADRELIHTVMENLVDNAIKYTPQNGEVTVSVSPGKKESVRIAVWDTGIGIEPKYHLRIFQRFYCVDKARSRKIGGTGLGLAIVKHIIERHGSRIFVESEPGKGSCFYFELKRID
ncbi:MAG: cell wall metabolism sensor histidine kinase WalK [Calditrichaeota bacterium]|nr:cell wall metabolism sensor histidine kinase WalK [Calditrichota bacterium]